MSKRLLPKLFVGGGTALETFSDISDGEAAWSTGMFNSRAALRDADLTEEAGEMDIRQFQRQGRDFVGEQKAGFSAMNTAFDGSAMDIMADTMAQIKLEEKNRARTTSLRAGALRNEAAQSARMGAHGRRQSFLKAGGALFSGANDLMKLL